MIKFTILLASFCGCVGERIGVCLHEKLNVYEHEMCFVLTENVKQNKHVRERVTETPRKKTLNMCLLWSFLRSFAAEQTETFSNLNRCNVYVCQAIRGCK